MTTQSDKYTLHNLDCLDVAKVIDGKVNLVYLDPPYGPKSEDQFYGVGENVEEFLEWLKQRFMALASVVAENGNIIVHMDWKCVHEVKVIGDLCFGGRKQFLTDISWCYSSPSVAKSHLPRKHDTLLLWGMGKTPTFNPLYIPYKNLTSKLGSAWGGLSPDKIATMKERGKLLEDWWIDIPSLCRNEGEKTGWKTQKPVALLKRIVEMFSNPGDLVLDGMMGSGTTGEACLLTGRKFVGFDINKDAIDIASKRLEKVLAENKSDLF